MKKIIHILMILVLVSAYSNSATLTGGVGLGLGTMSDSDLCDIYGRGFVYNPYLSFSVSSKFSLGLGYEGGYKKDGNVGIFEDAATLEISGFQLFVKYDLGSGKLIPYLKLGYGYYTVKNDYDSGEMDKYGFSEKGSGLILGAGFSYPMSKGFFITAEAGYLMLKVKPFTKNVDTGGFRLLIGLAAKFNL